MEAMIYMVHKPAINVACDTLEEAMHKLDRNGSEQISCRCGKKEYWRITCGKFLWVCDPEELLDNELALFTLNAPCVEDSVAYKIRCLAEDFGCDEPDLTRQAEWVKNHYEDQIEVACGGWHFRVNPGDWDGARNAPKKGWWY